MRNVDLVVIGGGSAGMSAATAAAKQGVGEILLLEKNDTLGGILFQCIHNGFGLHHYKEELTGPEYAEREMEALFLEKVSVKVNTMVLHVSKDLQVAYSNQEEGYQVVQAKAIVLATGCIERTRGQISLPGDRVTGVITAGLAQRYVNIDGYMVGKRVFVLGSGDIGLIMARRMVLEGAEVLGVAEIMPYSNGLTRNIVQCLEDYQIPLYLSHTVIRTIGKDRLEKVVIAKVDEKFEAIPGTEQTFEVDTLLLSVGLIPSVGLVEGFVEKHPKTKGPMVDDSYMTSIPGIFACGNCLHVHDLVDYVSEEGEMAGMEVAKYLVNIQEKKQVVEVVASEGVSYIVPSKIALGSKTQVVIRLRPTKPYQNVYLVFKNNEQTIKRIKKAFLLPAEMETIRFPLTDLKEGVLTVEVEHA